MVDEKVLNTIIAKNINIYMTRLGLTQLDVAKYMGCSQATISNWCKGIKLPRMDKIDRLCALFGCPRSALMEDKEISPLQQMRNSDASTIDMAHLIALVNDESKVLTYNGTTLTSSQRAAAKASLAVFKNIIDAK